MGFGYWERIQLNRWLFPCLGSLLFSLRPASPTDEAAPSFSDDLQETASFHGDTALLDIISSSDEEFNPLTLNAEPETPTDDVSEFPEPPQNIEWPSDDEPQPLELIKLHRQSKGWEEENNLPKEIVEPEPLVDENASPLPETQNANESLVVEGKCFRYLYTNTLDQALCSRIPTTPFWSGSQLIGWLGILRMSRD